MTTARRTAQRWTGNALVATGCGLSALGLASGAAAIWQVSEGPAPAVVAGAEQNQSQRQQAAPAEERVEQRVGWTVRECVGDLAGTGASASALQDLCGAAVESAEQGSSAKACDEAAYWALSNGHGIEVTYKLNGAITEACALAVEKSGAETGGASTSPAQVSTTPGPTSITVKPAEPKLEHGLEVAALGAAGIAGGAGGVRVALAGTRLRRRSRAE